MRERWVYHVTMNTGHVRRSPRSEVSDGVIEMMLPLVDRALKGEHVPIPGDLEPPGCTMTGGASGRCMSLLVAGAPLSQEAFPQAPVGKPVPIVEVGVAEHSRCGAKLWRALHEMARNTGTRVSTSEDRCPPEPWVAALLLSPGAAIYSDAMQWLGDFERCVAWTWIEMLSRKT